MAAVSTRDDPPKQSDPLDPNAERAPNPERAALEAYAQARSVSEKHHRRRSVFEILIGLTAPPLVGMTILFVVLSGNASAAVERSGGATSSALIVGALLILLPPIIFAVSPDRYAEYQTNTEERLRELAPGPNQ